MAPSNEINKMSRVSSKRKKKKKKKKKQKSSSFAFPQPPQNHPGIQIHTQSTHPHHASFSLSNPTQIRRKFHAPRPVSEAREGLDRLGIRDRKLDHAVLELEKELFEGRGHRAAGAPPSAAHIHNCIIYYIRLCFEKQLFIKVS
jgi:hypothetical protein